MKNETPFEFPGWYINFQTAVLKQLPRPGVIDQTTALGWEKNQEALKKNLAEVLSSPKPTPSILELVSTVVVSVTTGKFVAKDKFVIDIKHNAKLKIQHLGGNFKLWFLNGDGKTEDLRTEQILHCHKLRKSSVDGPIIKELGGEEKAETSLTEMLSLMKKQKNGEDGVLLNNSYANIFYIRDRFGVLRAICVYWRSIGWSIFSCSVENPSRWCVDFQVFSRNSDLLSSEPSAPAQV